MDIKKVILPLFASATILSGALFVSDVSAAEVTVTNWEEFSTALAGSDNIIVSGDIKFEDNVTIDRIIKVKDESVLDLDGYTVELSGNGTYGLLSYANLTITGYGTINSTATYPIIQVDGDLTIENGTYEGTTDVYYFFQTSDEAWDGYTEDGKADANIYIKGGDFNVPYSVINNFGPGNVIISSGSFNSTGDEYGDAYAILNGLEGTVEINGDDVEIVTVNQILGDDVIDEAEERGAIICTKGFVYENELSAYTICGSTIEADEDAEIDDGEKINIINNSHITIPKEFKLTNNGEVYVDATSSLKVCRDNYVGEEDAIFGEGEIIFDCDEEEEEAEVPEETETEESETVEAPEEEGIENPETLDDIAVLAGMLSASMLGLVIASSAIAKAKQDA